MRTLLNMKMLYCQVILFGCLASAVAQEPVLVRSFPMKPTRAYPTLAEFKAGSLYYLENPTGDNIAYPYLIKQGEDFGIVDYLTDRTLWLDEQIAVRKSAGLGPRGAPQGDGYFVEPEGNFVSLYKSNFSAEKSLLVQVPNVHDSFEGGVWFQSNTLFFWDERGDLHVVENPIDTGNTSPERANPVSSIMDREYAKTIVTINEKGKFSGLAWDDRYGVMKNGLPLAQRYDKDWQLFYEDQRNLKKNIPKLGYRPASVVELGHAPLIDTDTNGNQYWGWAGDVIVAKNGYIIATFKLPEGRFNGSIVLPSGDIVLSSRSEKKQLFEIYKIKKTW